MRYLILVLLAVFPFGQLVRWNLFGTEAVLHLNDLAVLLVLIFGLRKISGPLVKPLFLFLLAVAVSLALNFTNFKLYELVVASLYPLRFAAYAGLYFVFWTLGKEEKNLTRRWLLLAILIVAISGLLQYVFVPDVSFLSAFDWDDHYYRLVGSFLDPGFTGAILVLGLLFSFVSLPVSFVWYFLMYLAMALTYSRASYLMYLVSFGVIAWYQRSLKIFFAAFLILFVTLITLPRSTGEGTKLSRENSILARISNWKESITIWQNSPVFGVGFNTYRYVRNIGPESHAGAGADSSILLVLATTGAVGFFAYLNLLRSMWLLGRRDLLFVASLLGIMAHSFFNNTFFYPWVMEWLWLVLATKDYT